MKKKVEKNSYYFIIVCFSTDKELYSPLPIIKKYLNLEQCSNVKNKNINSVEYDHCSNITSGRITRCKFYEITNLENSDKKINLADSFLILINLESVDIYTKIDLILSYINNYGKRDLKLYLIGIYKDINKITSLNNKNDIDEYLKNQNINYDYKELNFDSNNDLVSILSFIINDTLKNKMFDYLNQSNDIDLEKDRAKSKCIIF